MLEKSRKVNGPKFRRLKKKHIVEHCKFCAKTTHTHTPQKKTKKRSAHTENLSLPQSSSSSSSSSNKRLKLIEKRFYA